MIYEKSDEKPNIGTSKAVLKPKQVFENRDNN